MKQKFIKDVELNDEEIVQHDERWIDVHDDDVMRAMGFFRPFNQSPRDPSVWRKTPREREALKRVKTSWKHEDGHFHTSPRKQGCVRAKLIVQLRKNKEFPNTTYSFVCLNTAIDSILGRFLGINPKTGFPETLVAKYTYNGKTYTPQERPWVNR